MTDIQIFKNEKFGEVRVITNEQGEPMFAAADVCNVLGYANPSKAISDHVDEEDRYNQSLERGGSMLFINESGLYSLILRSNKPNAKTFKKWVTAEVLPAVRKTGGYQMQPLTQGQMLVQMAQAYERQERMMLEQQAKQREMESQIHKLECVTDVNYGFMAVLGYAKLHNIAVTRKEAAKIGKAASKYCRDNNIQYGSQKHPIFGNVNIYPDHALQAVFPRFYPNAF